MIRADNHPPALAPWSFRRRRSQHVVYLLWISIIAQSTLPDELLMLSGPRRCDSSFSPSSLSMDELVAA